MTMTNASIRLKPVILCGGAGTRLWPLSRKSYPKQFASLTGAKSLFQQCALRLSDSKLDVFHFAPPTVVSGSDFRFIVTEQLAEVGIEADPVLIEPDGRNTAPAVLAAVLQAAAQDPDVVLLIAPSDHVIVEVDRFHAALATGLKAVRSGQLVTFGITPDRIETGYGYMQLSAALDGSGVAVPLKRFVEKPDTERAEKMIATGDHLWNSGIFLFSAKDILAAFYEYAPDLIAPVQSALDGAEADLDFLRLDQVAWSEVENISFDFAVMEKTPNISVVPYDGKWSDLGSWEAILRESHIDDHGVSTKGSVLALDCEDSLLRSEESEITLVGLGLKNIVAVATQDAVLVADMSRTQDVKRAVEVMKANDISQATQSTIDHRPWGQFQVLILGDRFQVKRIVVKPGGKLSLQSHHHRSEHWIVVSGTAKITIGEEEILATENQSVYVPLGVKHRMENPGKVPMVLIEVQTGAYLGEDDIIRYEDIYSRNQGAKG